MIKIYLYQAVCYVDRVLQTTSIREELFVIIFGYIEFHQSHIDFPNILFLKIHRYVNKNVHVIRRYLSEYPGSPKYIYTYNFHGK